MIGKCSSHGLPTAAIIWGLATAAFALRAPQDLQRLDADNNVRSATTILAVASAAGAIIVAVTAHGHNLSALGQRGFFAAWGVEIALLIVFARAAMLGHVAPWSAKALYLAFVPALCPGLVCSYLPLGVGAPVATTTAIAISFVTIAVLGFASAFGLRVAPKRRRAPVVTTAAAVLRQHAPSTVIKRLYGTAPI